MSFSILLLSVCTSLELKCVSSRQHIYRSSFCIHLASLCLLIRAINPFQFNSVAQLCPTLCDPVEDSTPGIPVHHQLLGLTQTHVHWVGDVIQPFHPLSSPSPPTFNLSQHQGLFTSGGQRVGVSASTSVFPMNIQDWFSFGWTGWISLQSKGLSRVFSNTTVQKHQFFSTQPSLRSNSHIYTWPLEKPLLWLDRPLLAK